MKDRTQRGVNPFRKPKSFYVKGSISNIQEEQAGAYVMLAGLKMELAHWNAQFDAESERYDDPCVTTLDGIMQAIEALDREVEATVQRIAELEEEEMIYSFC